jgi:hypothetical protein
MVGAMGVTIDRLSLGVVDSEVEEAIVVVAVAVEVGVVAAVADNATDMPIVQKG